MASSPPTLLRVLFFGPIRAQLGMTETELECAEPIPPGEFWLLLLARYPELKPLRGKIRLARRGDFLPANAMLEPGDEIALIPPVSGG